jgi:hypothetical protein
MPFLYFNILSIIWQLLLSVKWRAVGCQSALHKENSRFATPTLGWHISTFRGYQILFSIQNPYINRFTNHFSIRANPELEWQICCFPYAEHSDIPRLQQVEQKAIGRQRNLRLPISIVLWVFVLLSIFRYSD